MFKAVVKVETSKGPLVLESQSRGTMQEAVEDGEISKSIWGGQFISCIITEC